MLTELLLLSTKADPWLDQPSLNSNPCANMNEASKRIILKTGAVKSGNPIVDKTGNVYGKITVIRFLGVDQTRRPRASMWECQCECGIKFTVRGGNLNVENGIKSCRGCACKKHGRSSTPEYWAFKAILYRCQDERCPEYHCYGGRGIGVCSEWDHISKFEAFLSHVGLRPTRLHSIHRIDNNGNYEPGNVKWATREEQDACTTRTVRLTFRGETLHKSAMARKYGMGVKTLEGRINRGWTIEDSLLTPIGGKPSFK